MEVKTFVGKEINNEVINKVLNIAKNASKYVDSFEVGNEVNLATIGGSISPYEQYIKFHKYMCIYTCIVSNLRCTEWLELFKGLRRKQLSDQDPTKSLPPITIWRENDGMGIIGDDTNGLGYGPAGEHAFLLLQDLSCHFWRRDHNGRL